MTRKEQLQTIIVDHQQRTLPEIWPRAFDLPLESGKIITLSGVRRSGKTHQLFRLMQQLRSRGVAPRQILYINFEDERLQLTTAELDLILTAYRELYPDLDLASCYFFFDEIQEVDGWEKFIARIYASVSRQVFITGSNAKLLSREIATALRGRTLTFEVYPLSFAEYVSVLTPQLNTRTSAGQAKLQRLFGQFMHQGGFPELIGQDESLQQKTLQEYFSVMLFRDLIERYQIGNTAVLKYFCKRVIAASAGEFSVHKIYQEFKSQGYQVAKDTLYAYQQHVDAIYLSRFLNKYSHSVVKAESAQKKAYVIDQGLGAALDYKLAQDEGRLLETTVALELLKSGQQVNYQCNGSECDFVLLTKSQVTAAVQVTLHVHDAATRQRELKGLLNTCHQFGLKQGTILTLDHSEEILVDGVQIAIRPAWRYFLEAGNAHKYSLIAPHSSPS